nr:hypothetical protein [Nocardia sp. BMG111209]
MSDDSTQLSVAELLARNGKGSPSSGGGGRRRRGGRGISVNELTGDLPIVKEGSSAHAAPEEEASPEPPARPAEGEAYSPLSGPISLYDPLSPAPAPEPWPAAESWSAPPAAPPFGGVDREPVRYQAPAMPDSALREPGTFGWPDPAAPNPHPFAGAEAAPPKEGRRARREREERIDPLSDQVSVAELEGTVPPPTRGGRRRRRREEEDTADVQPFRGGAREAAEPPALRRAPEQLPPPPPPPDTRPKPDGRPGPAAGPRPGPPRPGPGPGPAWQGGAPQGRPEAAASPWGVPGAAPIPPDQRRDPAGERTEFLDPSKLPRSARRGPNPNPAPGEPDLPEWSARRRKSPERPAPGTEWPTRDGGRRRGKAEPPPPPPPPPDEVAGAPTAVWSLAGRDQQLLSGPTLAGDLIRADAERESRRGEPDREPPRRGEPPRGEPPRGGRGARRGATAVRADELDDLDDLEDEHDFYDPDLDDDLDLDDEDDDRRPARRRRRPAGGRSWSRAGAVDPNRKQWMVLGGQAVGAAVAGMLLFKGFEKMWDVFPFVALALAMVVILGLVALVRVLRRTDDITSTVIAVVVGIFVTLGPLAFLLSTN